MFCRRHPRGDGLVQLVRAGAVGGAAIGGTIDVATLGHSFLLGTVIGGIVGGAVTPILAQLLAAEGRGGQAGLLLSVAGVLSLAGLLLAKRPAAAV